MININVEIMLDTNEITEEHLVEAVKELLDDDIDGECAFTVKKDDKWQKLKKWLNEIMQVDRKVQSTGDLRAKHYAQVELTILNKMQELESANESRQSN